MHRPPAGTAANSAATTLSARGLTFSRGGRRVFGGIDFDLRPGQMLQVLGANGSGKTSLLRVLGGLVPPDEGELLWRDEALHPVDRDSHPPVAYVGHANGIDADLTSAENLRFAARLGGVDGSPARIEQALRALGLDAVAPIPVRALSQGQRRRVALARLALLQRRLWLLDEPLSSLDSASGALFLAQLDAHLQAHGMAVVATHESLASATQTLRMGA